MGNIRFGILGCGYFGGEFARILNKMEGSEVVAVLGGSSGKTAKAIAEEINCEIADSLESLICRDDIDAIIVASPNNAHKEAVLLAAKHGKHVFCEKPIALTYADCNEMIAACEQASVLFMAGHIMHFISGIQQVKRLITNGDIGEIMFIHSERTGWVQHQETVTWKTQLATSGGHLFHHIHELDLIQSFLGPAESISTVGGNFVRVGDGYGDDDDILLLTMKFRNRAYATMQYGAGFRWGENYVKINGTEGAILIDFKRSVVELKKNYKITEYMLFEKPEENEAKRKKYEQMDGGVNYGKPSQRPGIEFRRPMIMEMRCFLDAILQKPIEDQYKLLFDNTSARSSIRTAEAAMQSMKEDAWVQIKTIK
jgi:predicted dehydrogenase